MHAASRILAPTRNLLHVARAPRSTLPSCYYLFRGLATTALAPALTLSSEQWLPESHAPAKNEAMVICHGLFGSGRNWRALAKSFARSLQMPVYTLDLRNHGSSPHSEVMDYASMANDVLEFCRVHDLSNVTLLGHSMGGKVAMTAALQPGLADNLISRLIVADMTPAKGSISDSFKVYLQGMQEVEKSKVKDRKAADKILQSYESDIGIRQFLLTNLLPTTADEPHHKFRLPLNIIAQSLPAIGDFPYEPGEYQWPGRALFIKGEKSKYINRHNLPVAEQYFPNMKAETIYDAGHWVHSEQPLEFTKVVGDFIRST
ncbi:hypothetical protein BOTBODRAFT_31413 [Botryobasidium botryosum FD-172 SS1]|uniref:AB hydrolase-1 domain-containing protein n=1 Tax=Botryobasidium botryosum (strain FD-172 SS1) TaxID=930990 RepID=A0A067MWP6_BOTB1|nr:hypothetical protein BOTBODRAFT_31413 [Botryobasidium botryosum FD-172 SS1]